MASLSDFQQVLSALTLIADVIFDEVQKLGKLDHAADYLRDSEEV